MTTPTLCLVDFPQPQCTADWCEKNIYLSPRVPTSEPGQWRRRNVGALCSKGGPLESLDDPLVETVVVCKGSQTCLTTTAYSWLAKEMATDPGSALIVMNSTQDARDKSAETWRPIWEDSHELQRFLPDCRRKDWTKLYQRIHNSPVYWIGANSPGRLGAKPIRRLILDEVDKYPSGFGRSRKGTKNALSSSEAGAAALARQRTKAFRKKGMAKILEFSTPTDDQGEITQEYLNGDQRKLYVRCPHCQSEQVMMWANFKIQMDLAKSDPATAVTGAHYECPTCRKAWTDDDRWRAVDTGEWKPTAKARDPKCRSFHLPSWCSRFVTVGYLAAQWIKAQESQSALQDFINSECGEAFVHYENMVRDSTFASLEGEYQEGETFAEVKIYADSYKDVDRFVFGGCDVQKGYLMAVFRQFVRGGDSGLVWAGDVANLEALEMLSEKFGAQYVMIDQRYRSNEIQEWAFRHTGYIPCMGVTRRARALFTVSTLDLDEGKRGGGKPGRSIEVLDFDGDMLKDMLVVQIQRSQGARRWLVPKGHAGNAQYVAQMTAERCVNGRWVNPQNRPNHFWDAEALALLGAIRFGVWGQQSG